MACMITAVRNVIDGKTAYGSPSPLPPIAFPAVSSALCTLIHVVRVMEDILDREVSSDVSLTALIRKLAVYMTRRGTSLQAMVFAKDCSHAASFLIERPNLITSRMGFGRILKLAMAPLVLESLKLQRRTDLLTRFQLPPEVPRQKIWASDDRRYGLFELVHPKHVAIAGTLFGNCLVSHYVPAFDELRPSLGYFDSLPFLSYWQDIVRGRRRLFTFHEFHKPKALMSFDRDRLSEIDFRGSHDELLVALAEALAELSTHLDPPGLNLRSTHVPPTLTAALARRLCFAPASARFSGASREQTP